MKRRLAAAALIALGTLQMVGDISGWQAARALGAATHASPAPKVFTAQAGYETFSARFFVDWEETDGTRHSLELTPRVYRRLEGPYNRRNAYGAALSYAPVLASNPRTRPMLEQVTQFGFCGRAPLLRELQIPAERIVYPMSVRLEPRETASRAAIWQTTFQIDCTRGGESS
ncbi:MAG TPA: hypothetical protein VKE95_13980 [Burkholderiales bacterium]|nr:hypothetical protein [Burkholderiales bacterium]